MIYYVIKNIFYYKIRLGGIHVRARIQTLLTIDGGKNIYIGKSIVGYKTWLAAKPLTGSDHCKLCIGDSCSIGHFNHIYATKEIIIEDNVLTADKVYISDNLHQYTDVSSPIIKQGIKQLNPVRIGEGSWIGENVCVIGATIGKHCVIGANSVVLKDIPDYCVAVGSPAHVIKQYNTLTCNWEKVKINE